jgi:HSF-type DNA-binding
LFRFHVFNASTRKNASDELSKPLKDNHATKSRLNKFVRILHDMLVEEKDSGIVEWRHGVLVLHNTNEFSRKLLPKYFSTGNFKTFRRQLNYYGFVHVRSFSSSENAITAFWVNNQLANKAETDCNSVESILQLKRVEPWEGGKTTQSRREQKEIALHTMKDEIMASSNLLPNQRIKCSNSSASHANELIPGGSSRPISSKTICPVIRPMISASPVLDNGSCDVTGEDTSLGKYEDDHILFESNNHSICYGFKDSIFRSDEKASAAKVLLLLSKTN